MKCLGSASVAYPIYYIGLRLTLSRYDSCQHLMSDTSKAQPDTPALDYGFLASQKQETEGVVAAIDRVNDLLNSLEKDGRAMYQVVENAREQVENAREEADMTLLKLHEVQDGFEIEHMARVKAFSEEREGLLKDKDEALQLVGELRQKLEFVQSMLSSSEDLNRILTALLVDVGAHGL